MSDLTKYDVMITNSKITFKINPRGSKNRIKFNYKHHKTNALSYYLNYWIKRNGKINKENIVKYDKNIKKIIKNIYN